MVENKIPFSTPEQGASDDECVWAMICHLSVLFGGVVIPIGIYLLKGRTSPYIAFHARQAAVYQGSVFVLMVLTLGIVMFLAPLFVLLGVVWGFKARNGEQAGYPILNRFLSQESKL
jgi:uncharacterized Tic20 family protein